VLGEQRSNGKQAAAEYGAEQTTIQTIQGDGSSRRAALFGNSDTENAIADDSLYSIRASGERSRRQ
jgi:hypothetical protein